MEPAYVGYILAPTMEHRLQYSHWLNVHAKQHVAVSKRYARLLSMYEVSLDADRHDVCMFIN